MATPVILYGPDGKPLITGSTPWGDILLAVEPARVYGWFKAVTNSGLQTQTVVGCPSRQALLVTDIILSGGKTALSTITLRFHDGTNSENILVADTAEGTVNTAIHPSGRTLGWSGAYIQLLTDKANQVATCTVWFVRVTGVYVMSYAKWNTMRGL